MKKPNDFRVMSNVVCDNKNCNNKIKQNMVDRKEGPYLCFSCHCKAEKINGHVMYNILPAR